MPGRKWRTGVASGSLLTARRALLALLVSVVPPALGHAATVSVDIGTLKLEYSIGGAFFDGPGCPDCESSYHEYTAHNAIVVHSRYSAADMDDTTHKHVEENISLPETKATEVSWRFCAWDRASSSHHCGTWVTETRYYNVGISEWRAWIEPLDPDAGGGTGGGDVAGAPVPQTGVLLACGLGLVWAVRRRRG